MHSGGTGAGGGVVYAGSDLNRRGRGRRHDLAPHKTYW